MAEIGYLRAIKGAEPGVWRDAILEIVVVAGVSLIPLIGAAIRQVLPPDSKVYLSDAFGKAFLSGQLVFYALGLIATVVWQSNKDWKSFFPWRSAINIYCLAAISVSAIVIGYDPELRAINAVFLANFSVFMFLSAIVFYVFMSVVSQVQVNVGKEFSKSDDELGNAVRASRGLENGQ